MITPDAPCGLASNRSAAENGRFSAAHRFSSNAHSYLQETTQEHFRISIIASACAGVNLSIPFSLSERETERDFDLTLLSLSACREGSCVSTRSTHVRHSGPGAGIQAPATHHTIPTYIHATATNTAYSMMDEIRIARETTTATIPARLPPIFDAMMKAG